MVGKETTQSKDAEDFKKDLAAAKVLKEEQKASKIE
jgi:hypothetical protein